MGYEGVPLTEEEVLSFRKGLYHFYNSIKNGHLAEARESSNNMKTVVEKCFETELQILYSLFDTYLLLRELNYTSAQKQLEGLKDSLSDLTDEQRYYYYHFYAESIYEDHVQALHYLLKAEEIGRELHKQEANLFYSIANLFSRIDYTPKAIVYSNIALELAQRSSDKAYLLSIETTPFFEYSKIGFYQVALDGLHGCLMRYKAMGDTHGLQSIYHNLGNIYLFMDNYVDAVKYFEAALIFCKVDSWSYLNNNLYIAYVLIKQNRNKDAISFLDRFSYLAKDIPNMMLFFESAKHSLNLHNTKSLAYMEEISIPSLLRIGSHLKAIEYMNTLSDFYKKNKSIKKAEKHTKLALLYTTKILKGKI